MSKPFHVCGNDMCGASGTVGSSKRNTQLQPRHTDATFENQANLSPEFLLELAETRRLNRTPSLFIDGVCYGGSFAFEDLVEAIQSALE